MEKQQYIYTLKLIPQLLLESNWTERENGILGEHFLALKKLLEEHKLIMAGRTIQMDEKTFGIVVLDVESEEEARQYMENDPAVKEGIMTAELFPYKVALFNNSFGE
ncbi:YciI family protein [Peribacillus alkalitolerans]|uniref:YciI family protein n=1 Tax=Peribacillus alkalitolerans TaxID=1550385 RepID=UPI0013D15241|nr:YciI family protein [Peribacillus alkalitolerans]